MAHEYEDLPDVANLDDAELRELIVDRMRDTEHVDPDDVEVRVAQGGVTLEGRVGTEAELQRIERMVTDEIGISEVTNNLVVDELRRGEQSEAADVAAAANRGAAGGTAGAADRTEDSAEHLLDDTAAENYGTRNASEAAERGYSYEPPTEPPQEGTWSREQH